MWCGHVGFLFYGRGVFFLTSGCVGFWDGVGCGGIVLIGTLGVHGRQRHLASGLGSPPRGHAKKMVARAGRAENSSRGLHHASVLWACARPFGSVRFCLPHFAACVAVCLSVLRSPSSFSPYATAGPDGFRCRTGPSPCECTTRKNGIDIWPGGRGGCNANVLLGQKKNGRSFRRLGDSF